MHIVYLTPEYVKNGAYDGGLANYLVNITHSLSAKGYLITVIVSSDRNCCWEDEGVQIIEFSMSRISNRFLPIKVVRFFSLINIIRIGKQFRKIVLSLHKQSPINIIQAASYRTTGIMLLNNKKIPLVCRISSYTPLWRSALGFTRNVVDWLLDWLEVRLTIKADAAFAPSKLIAEYFEKIEGFRPLVLHTPLSNKNIITDSTFYNRELKGKKYFLYFGTLNRVKGIDILAEVIPKILKKWKDIHFVFIGRDDGAKNIKSFFLYINEKCQLFQPNLHYHSALPKNELIPVIRNALCVLMPSRIDNYPNACLESLVNGVPVIGTNNSSLEEIILDGKTGFLAKNDDVESFFSKIEYFLNLPETGIARLKRNINLWVEQRMLEDDVNSLVALYEKTINDFICEYG